MTRWEYDTEITSKWLAPEELATHGQTGWELVGFQVVLTNSGALNYYIFKRPIEEPVKMITEASDTFTATANNTPA